MAFWIKRPGDEGSEPELDNKKLAPDKAAKKEDAKNLPKRIDNLRVPERLKVHLRSFGTQNTYSFWTKDLSATGAFVLCLDFTNYPFQPASTVLEATIELRDPISGDVHNLNFLAKVARVVEAHGVGAALISGFGLRIIQMDFGERQVLETFIASYGRPDTTPPFLNSDDDTTIHFEYDYEKGIVKGGPLGARNFESHLEDPEPLTEKKPVPDAG